MRYQDPRVCELLAAEYVLGTLKGQARQRFEGLLHARPDLRRRVREWESRFSQVMGPSPAVPPPPEVWDALQRRLFAIPTPPRRWYERLAFWRTLTLGSSLLAATLAVLLLIAPFGEVPGYLVVIQDSTQQPVWLISAPADMSEFYIKNLKPVELPPGKRCLLWLKSSSSEQIYVLGVAPDHGERIIKVDKNMRPMLPGPLMVSIEEMDGKPPAEPTGPPVFKSEWMPLKKI
jgi:anti-sigma-K factor RskA